MESLCLSDTIQEIITTLTELKRMHQLNFELLEQLNVTCQWILDNKISIPNQEHLHALLCKSFALLNEIQNSAPRILQYQAIRRKLTAKSNRRQVNRTLLCYYLKRKKGRCPNCLPLCCLLLCCCLKRKAKCHRA